MTHAQQQKKIFFSDFFEKFKERMRFLCILLVLVFCVSGEGTDPHRRPYALLTDVKVLTLYKDRMTTGGRNAPIKQMTCVSGDACRFFTPEVMNCANVGVDDGGEVQWKCQAQMEDFYRLGQTQVSCEGYTNPDDPYILTGSCGVEYTLHLTAKGFNHHHGSSGPQGHQGPDGVRGPDSFHTTSKTTQSQTTSKEDPSIWLTATLAPFTFMAATFVTLMFICCLASTCPQGHNHPRPRVYEVQHPPPPVVHAYAQPPAARAYVQQPPVVVQQAPPVVVHHNHHSDSGPGFLTGFLLGGGGHRSDTSYQHHHHHHTTYEAPRHYSSSSSSSSHSSPPPSSSSSSSSSNTYTSTGFGGTKKR